MSGQGFTLALRPRADGADELVCVPLADAGAAPLALPVTRTSPPTVSVAAPAAWAACVPPWAIARRDAILAQLRAADYLVAEIERGAGGVSTTTIAAPDGGVTLECRFEPDERAAPWEQTRVLGPGGIELACLALHALLGAPRFGSGGSVELELRGRYGDDHRLRVDVAARTFFLDGGPAEPLDTLAARLEPPRPPPRPLQGPPGPRDLVRELFLGFLGFVFALAGLWVAIAAHGTEDRLAGLAGLALGSWTVREAVAVWRRRERR